MRHSIQLQIPKNISKEYLIDMLALLPDSAVIEGIHYSFETDCSVAVVSHPEFKEVPDFLQSPMAEIVVEELKLPFCETTRHPSKLVLP